MWTEEHTKVCLRNWRTDLRRTNYCDDGGSQKFMRRVFKRLRQSAWLFSEIADAWGIPTREVHDIFNNRA